MTVNFLEKIPQRFYIKVKSRFKKDLKLEIHLDKAFFSGNRFLDLLHKSFLNQTSLDLRKKNWTFLYQDFTVLISKLQNKLFSVIQGRNPYNFWFIFWEKR